MALKAKFKTLSWTDIAETATPAVKSWNLHFPAEGRLGFLAQSRKTTPYRGSFAC